MLEVTKVSKVYGKKKQQFVALKDVSFSVPSGASIAIVGKSGSGKSTLMHIMSGLDHSTSGTVKVDNVDISKLKGKTLDRFRAENIGFIFQAFFVQANESCYHNVALPLEIGDVPISKRKARIRESLVAVDLLDKINEKAGNLSGGQKQRLAIARAIANNPGIIFADEPTGNLDSATGNLVEKLLFDFNKKLGTTLVVVTHDDELAKKCDTQVYLKDGQIVKIENRKTKTKTSQKATKARRVIR